MTPDPHAYNAFTKVYPKYGHEYEVLHYTQLLAPLIDQAEFPNEVNLDVTFHDPCYLGRHGGEYDAPRVLLKAIPGLNLVEMERSRENGYCCGGGGGGMWLDGFTANHTTERLSERRVREAAQTGATALAVCCPYEVSRFEDGAKSTGNESLRVPDIIELLDEAMGLADRSESCLSFAVIDFGRVSALRSQTLWHALAYGVSAGGPPTLSFMRPSRPYVGLGYHRRLEEADLDACREAGLPVFRRMVGGGVVYLDEHQQFFQICLPVKDVPRSREQALRRLLAPAVAAFRAAGVPAELDDDREIVVGEAKICGHGAAQIDDAVVVVGNLIERFDHAAAARVLALPDEVRAEVVRLMERFVAATPGRFGRLPLRRPSTAYGEALGLEPVPGGGSSRLRAGSGSLELDERVSASAGRLATRGPAAAGLRPRRVGDGEDPAAGGGTLDWLAVRARKESAGVSEITEVAGFGVALDRAYDPAGHFWVSMVGSDRGPHRDGRPRGRDQRHHRPARLPARRRAPEAGRGVRQPGGGQVRRPADQPAVGHGDRHQRRRRRRPRPGGARPLRRRLARRARRWPTRPSSASSSPAPTPSPPGSPPRSRTTG